MLVEAVGRRVEQVNVPEALAASAIRFASEIDADALLIFTESSSNCRTILKRGLAANSRGKPKIVVATTNREVYDRLREIQDLSVIKLIARQKVGEDQIKHAIAHGMHEGIFSTGQRLVCLMGNHFPDAPDSLLVREVMGLEATLPTMESDPVLASAIEVAIELGHWGPKGRPIGSAFVIGDTKEVMGRSHQLMFNPFKGHSLMITNRGNWQTIKKYAMFLDGAFIVEDNGRILASARYLDADAKVGIPRGLGTRHIAVASITAVTRATGVTVSGEDGIVRVFKRGKIEAKINPVSRTMEHPAKF